MDNMKGISEDDTKVLELMHNLGLNFEEIKLILAEGIEPALEDIKNYQQPPWSKENIPEMDAYYQQLEEKYKRLSQLVKEDNNPH